MISLSMIENAAVILEDKVIKTPLVFSPTLSERIKAEVYLKLENLQKTGSFKIRGATHKIILHSSRIGKKGVVTASAGNHAQGVALAASQAGVEATIVMPEWASISKQEATVHYGGKVVLEGTSVEESMVKAEALSGAERMLIHPFDDPDIITGQATIGLEIFQQLPQVDLILVPVGGGGLISGIASASKLIRPEVKIIGVQAQNCPSAHAALNANAVVEVAAQPSLADGISVKKVGGITFDIMQRLVDDLALVDEGEIALAVLMLLERKKILSEGAGAAPLAALLNKAVRVPHGKKVVLIVSGGNVDTPLLGRVISHGLMEKGRLFHLRVLLDDRPGSLAGLLSVIAQLKANVLQVFHQRYTRHVPMNITRVELELETRGPSHIEEILGRLKQSGYMIESSSDRSRPLTF